jgi:hypothetical protein
MSNELPEWPVLSEYVENYVGELAVSRRQRNYERARAEAALARLRVAVEALQAMADHSTEWATKCVAKKTLHDIGEVPK